MRCSGRRTGYMQPRPFADDAAAVSDREVAAKALDVGVHFARKWLGLIEPEDIASTALYFTSDESRMVTGQVLPVADASRQAGPARRFPPPVS